MKVGAALILFGASLAGADVEALAECAAIPDDGARLSCFDDLAATVGQQQQNTESAPTAVPAASGDVAGEGPRPALPKPFGFPLGDSVSEGQLKAWGCTDQEKLYFCPSAPSPVSSFMGYGLVVHDGRLARVMALTETLEADRYGLSLRAEYSALKELLVDRYGEPGEDYDFIRTGAMFKAPEYFAASLKEGERQLSCIWKTGGASLMLSGHGMSFDSTSIRLVYDHDGLVASMAAGEADRDRSGL